MSHEVSGCEVVVVGAGVIGAACARAAAARGLQVAIFEPGPYPAAASPASAGMLAGQIEPSDEETLTLAVRSRELCAELAPTLREDTGVDVGFRRPGIAAIAFDDATAERLRDTVGGQRQAGLRADWLEPDEVRKRWPGAAPECRGALFAPEDGAVNPDALTRALLADARRRGAVLVAARVDGVERAGDRVAGVRAAGRTIAARHVVVAAGAWAPQLAGLPALLPVEPVRGQMAQTPWPPAVPPAILYHEHGYVLARAGRALLGSTMEHAGFDCRVTPDGLAQIFRAAARLVPALATLTVERTWAGLRPASRDGRPIVGGDPEVAGLWYATGHGRNGVLLAALTGEAIGDLMTRGGTDLDVRAWDPARLR